MIEEISLVLLALPLLGGAIIFFLPPKNIILLRSVALTFGFLTMLLSCYLFLSYDLALGGIQFLTSLNWLSFSGTGQFSKDSIQLLLGIDGISALMILLSGVVMFTGILISWNIKDRLKEYLVLYFLLIGGVFGVFISYDLFFFFFFYELSVLPMYLLVGVWGSSTDFKSFMRTKEYGAMKLTIYLVAGSVLIWIAILAIFVEAGIGSFSINELSQVEFPRNFQILFFALLALGFGVLAGLWPFHTWSPDGHVAAPTGVSMVQAGVLMKLGAFGIIRVGMTLLPEGANFWMPVIMVLGTINVIYGSVAAMAQRDLKYVIGYSSVSHMGYVLMGIASLHQLGLSGAVLQMFSHGIMTALFFTAVGIIYDRTHTRDIDVLQGLAKKFGFAASIFSLAAFASLGLPGLSGFVAELLVFLGLFKTYVWAGVLGIVGAALTAIYMLRLISRVFYGPPSSLLDQCKRVSINEKAGSLILAAFIIFIGLVPFPFIRLIDVGVSELLSGLGG